MEAQTGQVARKSKWLGWEHWLQVNAWSAYIGAGALIGLGYGGICLPSLPVGRSVHVYLHILGAILFLGSAIAGALWTTLAVRLQKREILAFAFRGLNITDLIFTAPGVWLLVANGSVLSGAWGGLRSSLWLTLAGALMAMMGSIWVFVLVPQQATLQRIFEIKKDVVWDEAEKKQLSVYSLWGSLVCGMGLVVLGLMVAKP